MTANAPPKKAKKALASMRNQHVQAAASGLFSFDSQEQAQTLLARFRRNFVISKEQDAEAGLRLWVKGFALTPEQEEQGYLGHFAVVRIKRKAGGKWTLLMEKLELPLASHPERRRPPKQHPDWGHPSLRAVRRGKEHANIESARRELLKLHEAFPEASIPGVDKLSILVYRKQAGGPPIEKVRLAIKPQNDKFVIAQIVKQDKAPAIPKAQGPEAVQGKFTALLQMKRKPRKNKP